MSELKAYIGLFAYYGKYLPNVSTTLAPLYSLLKKDVHWNWTVDQEQAFKTSKELLTSSSVLTHFDSNLPLFLACDTSSYGIGAALANRYPNGSEKPIAYTSRTLSESEKNYSQLEKKKAKRWSLFLSSYEYTLQFRNTTSHANADELSRLPVPDTEEDEVPSELVLLMEHFYDSPVSVKDVSTWTQRDPLLSAVHDYYKDGRTSVNTHPSFNVFPQSRGSCLFTKVVSYGVQG